MRNSILRKPFAYHYSNVVFVLIFINVAVYFINYIMPNTIGLMAMTPTDIIYRGYFWQFITYMFTHSTAGMSHILFNMLGLFFFGVQVEKRMGSSEFLLFYLLSGFLAGLFSFVVFYLSNTNIRLLGASGAVFAVLLAFAVYYPSARIYLMGIFPVKATHLVIGYTVIELYSQFMSRNSGVAHLTHLAGFGFAFIYFIVRLGINPVDVFRGGGRGGRWP